MNQEGTTRRGLLIATAAGVAAVVATTAGQSFGWLSRFNVLGPRVRGLGPQSLPVNTTAAEARVVDVARADTWRLSVTGPAGTRTFSLTDLRNMPQSTSEVPIACVEGWSSTADWSGVRVRDLVDAVGGSDTNSVRFHSLQEGSQYSVSTMGPEFVRAEATLLALDLFGEPLDLDHGFPARVIAPGRPGVLQTKWIASMEVLP